MVSPITNVIIKEHRSFRPFPSAYKVRNDRPLVFIQKACCWILGKLGCFHFDEDIAYTTHGIDSSSFMEKIFKSERCVQEFTGRKSAVLLIGAEDFQFMMASPEIRSAFSFSGAYQMQNRNERPTMFGLKVHVLPYLRGIAVLPDGL